MAQAERGETETSRLEVAFDKVSDVSKAGVNKLRNYMRRQYYQYGEWRNFRNAVAVTFSLLGLYLFFSLVAMVFLAPLAVVFDGITQYGAYVGGITALGFVGTSFYKARSDVKTRDRTYQLQQRPNAENAAEAYQYLDAYDDDTRYYAIVTIARASEDTPGKLAKRLPVDVETFVTDVVALLDDEHHKIRDEAATALAWFSRDYTDAVEPHSETLKDAMSYAGNTLRGDIAIALGNIGADYPSHVEEFARAVQSAVGDDDPEVRYHAAIALQQLPCDRSVDLLERLAQDDHPEVREQATESLRALVGGGDQPSSEGSAAAEPASPGDSNGAQDDSQSKQQAQREFVTDPPTKDFDDIAGMEDLKTRLRRNVIEPFGEETEAYEKFGVGSESGILLHGPPGTGKTHIAQCLAGELGTNYAAIDVGDVVSKYVGAGVENVKQVFAEARANEPCLVFIDEIDALGADRGGDSGMTEDKKQMVNQLLQELSDIDPNDDLLVIAATNRPDDVDDALLRSGRFDSKIEIPKPDEEARWQIFQQRLTGPAEDIPRDQFVRETSGFSASDIVEIERRASRKAAVRERESDESTRITAADVFEAIEELGDEQSSTGKFIRDPPETDFDDVVGMEGLKNDLREKVIDPLENPEQYEEFGLGVEHGFLLYGPPGTGKTYVSKALAGELDINYIEAKAGDLVSKWIGEGAQNVQQMFDEARENEPCLVFIDEIDALATDRGAGTQQKSERQMVNQFLEELSSINDGDDDVVAVAATNRPDDVDDAMVRSGRLGEKIEVPPPGPDTRAALFEAHLDAPHDDLDHEWLAERTDGLVASDMAQLANESARTAMRRFRDDSGPEKVLQEDVEQALEKVSGTSQAY